MILFITLLSYCCQVITSDKGLFQLWLCVDLISVTRVRNQVNVGLHFGNVLIAPGTVKNPICYGRLQVLDNYDFSPYNLLKTSTSTLELIIL
jgi:hypothetical protein